jgi:hypothetical protein
MEGNRVTGLTGITEGIRMTGLMGTTTRVTGLTKTLEKNSAGLWAQTFTWDFSITSQSGNSDELKALSREGNRNTTILTTA